MTLKPATNEIFVPVLLQNTFVTIFIKLLFPSILDHYTLNVSAANQVIDCQ